MSDNHIRLSPLVRLTMTFDAELNLDKNDVFGRETYEKYLEMHQRSEAKQEKVLRSLLVVDALLFLVINGQNWKIPGLGIEISSLPAIQEILLFSSSITFFFLCAQFVTNQCYVGVIDQLGNRIVKSDLIDPDFFNASRKHFDFFLKIYRPKMNIWGVDFYQHMRGFAIFSAVMNLIIIAAILVLPTIHFVLVIAASIDIATEDWSQFGKWFLLVSVALINVGGLVMVLGISKDFTFEMPGLKKDENEAQIASNDTPKPAE